TRMRNRVLPCSSVLACRPSAALVWRLRSLILLMSYRSSAIGTARDADLDIVEDLGIAAILVEPARELAHDVVEVEFVALLAPGRRRDDGRHRGEGDGWVDAGQAISQQRG